MRSVLLRLTVSSSHALSVLQSSFRHPSTDPDCPSERYLLYREWAHPKNIFKLQPLDFIRLVWPRQRELGIYIAGLVLGTSERDSSVLRAGTYTRTTSRMWAYFEHGFTINQFMKRQSLKFFLWKVWSFSLFPFFFFSPFLSSYKSIKVVIEIPSCNTSAITKFKPEEYDHMNWHKMSEMKSHLKQKCEFTSIS